MAIGKVAETSDILDIQLKAKFNSAVYGQVRGLGSCPVIPNNSNLNNYLTPGVYSIRSDNNAKTMANIPIQYAGVLVVASGLGAEVNPSGAWQYVIQTYIPYLSSSYPSYERSMYAGGTAGTWTYNSWVRNARIIQDSYGVCTVDVPNATSSAWFKTPTLGLLPYTIGTNSSIGSSTWRFSTGYFANLDMSGTTWGGGGFYTPNAVYYYARTTDNTNRSILGISSGNNVFLGYSPGTGTNNTNIYSGARINLICQCGDSYPGQTLELYREQSGSFREIFSPATTGTIYLGASSKRFNTAFFTNAITASDLKEKDIIEDFDFKAKDFIMNLKPIAYTRTGKTDGGKRIHMGFGAQTVAKTINNLDMGDLALVQASIIYEEKDKEGNTIISESPYKGEEIDDNRLTWGINYTEVIPQLVKLAQEQQVEIDSLKKEIDELKTLVNKLIS
jgi:hypothetical protein